MSLTTEDTESTEGGDLMFTLRDQGDYPTNALQCQADHRYGSLYLRFDGYGDAHSEDGHGWPVCVELYENELRVVVWSDIDKQDPTHIIPLTKAKESLRRI
jgi:hypothetical protein